MPSWSEIGEIVKGIADAAGEANDVVSLIETVVGIAGGGGDEAIEDALADLSNAVSQGFAEMVAAINDQNLQQQWSQFSTQLYAIQQTYQKYATEFSLMQQVPANSGNWFVPSNGMWVTFQEWCEGHHGTGGSIAVLWNAVEQLFGLTQTGGIANQPMLSLWSSLCTAAISSNQPQFAGQSIYNLTYEFMQEIYATLSAIYYVHEAAMQIYNGLGTPAYMYISLVDYVSANFGDVGDATSLWGQFGALLAQQLTSQGTYTPDETALVVMPAVPQCATDCGSYTGADAYGTLGTGAPYSIMIANVATTIADYQRANGLSGPGFFGNLQLTSYTDGDQVTYFLAGIPIQLGAPASGGSALTMTEGDWFSMIDAKGSYPYGTSAFQLTGSGDTSDVNYAYIHTYFFQPPSPALTANQMLVVTGFQIATIGNRMAVQLQYSVLDVTDPGNPTVSAIAENEGWGQPVVNPNDGYYALLGSDGTDNPAINYVDLRPAGTADSYPFTNATFTPYVAGGTNRIGLSLQTALPMQNAAFFQPSGGITGQPIVPPVAAGAKRWRRSPRIAAH